MNKELRYGDVASAMAVQQRRISYNLLTPKPQFDVDGNEISYRSPKVQLRGRDVYHLLRPYLQVRFVEQLKAVMPLVVYMVLFQLLILHVPVKGAYTITIGLCAVIIGLMFFMEGLKLGLMPFGENIGDILPRKLPLAQVLLIVLLLGIGVTFAEPAIGALETAGTIVNVNRAPYLYLLLNQWSGALVLVVGTGVGLAAVIATLRLLRGWSLKPLVYFSLVPTLILTLYMMTDESLRDLLGVAWDCGAITTGPVTVPLVLALGIGVAAASGKSSDSLSGFGIVTLASLIPVLGVLLLGIYIKITVPLEMVQELAKAVVTTTPQWYEQTPIKEIMLGIRAIVPLVIFLLIVLVIILREEIARAGIVTYGIILTIVGMIIFNLGLTYGLAELGNQSGNLMPAVFQPVAGVAYSPVFDWYFAGIIVTFAFAWLLGYGATLAEPALHAVGLTVETLTQGAFKKSLLVHAVSFGVAWGIALGVIKLIFAIPLPYFLLPGYVIALVMTVLSEEEFVNIAWDSAGVTTGPITVPLVLAIGLGLGNALDATEGFGILALASIGPIISVLGTGLWIKWQVYRSHSDETNEFQEIVP
ncbi:MAG: hypothetical protein BWK79_01805 [Beggiatoa sp. IS2]|nr:MAG: hypothetical protein BWK79_01805 [Beggiatoa sp. IS2]